MGALKQGLKEKELKPLVKAWRNANPSITQLWWDVEEAAMDALQKGPVEFNRMRFECESGILFITLPSGRNLAYVRPRIETGSARFG